MIGKKLNFAFYIKSKHPLVMGLEDFCLLKDSAGSTDFACVTKCTGLNFRFRHCHTCLQDFATMGNLHCSDNEQDTM